MRPRHLIIGICLAAVALVVVLVLFVAKPGGEGVPVKIYAIPSDAMLFVDGKAVDSSLSVSEGRHEFLARKDGFADDKLNLHISGEGVREIYLIPQPRSQAAYEWAAKNITRTDYEEYRAMQSQTSGESLRTQAPVLRDLPHYDIAGPYTIDYGVDEKDQHPFLLIDNSTAEGRQKALQWMRDHGYNPAELDIRFVDFTNPTTGAHQ